MNPRWPLLLVLAGAAIYPAKAAEASAVETPAIPGTVRNDERVLRAGASELRVSVVDAPDRPIDPARAAELQRWLAQTAESTLAAFGRFPLPQARVRIEQIDSRDRSPVPWGQTSRRDGVAVLLYVRADAGLSELREDWTAAHELAHLFHPYLGGDGRWLAEGLASYYQNVLRARVGLLEPAQAWQELDAGFARGRREASGARLDELSRRHRGTMRVYWAGAAYWLEADLALRREHASSLDAALSQYARCCLRGTGLVEPAAFVAQLDAIAGGEVFQRLYRRYAASREFPPLDAAYAALGLETRDGVLKFSNRPDAVRLRRALMGRRPALRPDAP
ncbi:hypothetical protein ACFQZQ_05545 [Lysobacter koreensis]|uniref:Peptidase M61 catalytic domain-containing protein n=1 Tax=Lysobacter koreensis TaxID=266122 RepID=A0ABW2YKC9_9GAMM